MPTCGVHYVQSHGPARFGHQLGRAKVKILQGNLPQSLLTILTDRASMFVNLVWHSLGRFLHVWQGSYKAPGT